MEKKPKRRTRERILEGSLALFNALGEPNVTTAAIADELGISPGNLYYHFHTKDEIVNAVFKQFERELAAIPGAPEAGALGVDEVWRLLETLFALAGRYRFLYRDLPDLVTRYRLIETHFRKIIRFQTKTTEAICAALAARGEMRASREEIAALAINVSVVLTNWPAFDYVCDPRRRDAGNNAGRGAFQIMALAAPYLQGAARERAQELARRYAAAA